MGKESQKMGNSIQLECSEQDRNGNHEHHQLFLNDHQQSLMMKYSTYKIMEKKFTAMTLKKLILT
jgi:hypothetical protein